MTAGRRPRLSLDIAGPVLFVVAARWSTIVSRAPLTYDDGVYLASVVAMRSGGLPYRDVFSSQGPLFLPLLWLGDVVVNAGGWAPWAPRLVPLAGAIVLTVLAHRVALRMTDRIGAAVAAAAVATSGTLFLTSTSVASDTVAAAFAGGALAAAAGVTPRAGRGRLVVVAVLIGSALAVKSGLVAGPAVAVVWLVARRRGWTTGAVVAAGALLTIVAVSVPWGLGNVVDQFVGLHLDSRRGYDTRRNVGLLREAVWRQDRPFVVLIALAAGWAIVDRIRRSTAPAAGAPPGDGLVTALWLWAGIAIAVLLWHHPLFVQHLTVLVFPAALLLARYRPPAVAIAVVAALLLVAHGGRADFRLTQEHPTPSEAEAVRLLRAIEPADGLVITDAQGLAWLAGRGVPGPLVDTSHERFHAGSLSGDDIVAAADDPEVCAVLIWTGRLRRLGRLHLDLPEYRQVWADGGRSLLLRDRCRLGAG